MLPSLKAKAVVYLVLTALVFGGAWHYRSVIAKNADLVRRVLELQTVVDGMEIALEEERRVAREALEARRRSELRLEEARRDREADTESREWGNTPVPESVKERLCRTLEC